MPATSRLQLWLSLERAFRKASVETIMLARFMVSWIAWYGKYNVCILQSPAGMREKVVVYVTRREEKVMPTYGRGCKGGEEAAAESGDRHFPIHQQRWRPPAHSVSIVVFHLMQSSRWKLKRTMMT